MSSGASSYGSANPGLTGPAPIFARDGIEVHQVRTPELGDSSYLVTAGGEAALVDVQRDLDRFREALAATGARPVAVLETHVHNDYVSGGAALAAELGVDYVVPAGAGYEGMHRGVREGDRVPVGPAALRAMFTPGHTPHHMSYEVCIKGQGVAVLSGGCLLVAACGRTDLISGDLTEGLARLQHGSARRIGALPDPTGIGPTHGAGSFCASSSGPDETWTTVGAEKGRNPALLLEEDEFVRTQVAGLPAHPTYYAHMAPINRHGSLGWSPPRLAQVDLDGLDRLAETGVAVVDGRPRAEFAAAHLPGSTSIEFGDSFSAYVGWLFPFGTPLTLIAGSEEDTDLAVRQCARIGIDDVRGWLGGRPDRWRGEGRPLRSFPRVRIEEMEAAWRAGGTVLDVRDATEWRGGHVPGARHVHVPRIPESLDELRSLPGPIHVQCASGYRAATACSLLEAGGLDAVLVDDDFARWAERGLPLESG